MNVLAGSVAGLVVTAAACAQTTWWVDGGAPVRIVGPELARVTGVAAQELRLPAGKYAVHFAADALGKPRSLAFAVADGADVRVVRAAAAPAVASDVAIDEAAAWRAFTGGAAPDEWRARCTGTEVTACRVDATFVVPAGGGRVGLVARWLDPRQHYRCVWDCSRGELRLERQHGDAVIQLGRAAVPAAGPGEVHSLAMQIEGFRIAVSRDDEVVLQAFDGAFTSGACGTWSAGDDVQWQRFAIGVPAPMRASVAIVQHEHEAVFHAAVTTPPGGFHVLELSLDRAHPPLPVTAAGIEPGLLQGCAAPRIVIADWRNSLGDGVLGEVPADGMFASTLQVPTNLHGQCAMVRALLVSADGEAIEQATPAVVVRL